jgi:hypothetical protein
MSASLADARGSAQALLLMKNACTGRIVEREHCDDYMKYGDVIRETFSQHSPQYGLLPKT